MKKLPLISEEELTLFRVRADYKGPKEKLPFCLGQPVLSLPECNHLVGKTPNLCQLRKSCAMMYAERLHIDLAPLRSVSVEEQYPKLVSMIKETEQKIKFIPEIGIKALESQVAPKVEPKEEPKEISMDDALQENSELESESESASESKVTMRDMILDILRANEAPVTKVQILEALRQKLGVKILNPAKKHRVSLVLLPKSQIKFGYSIDKQVQSGTYYYKLINNDKEKAQVQS